MFLSHASADKEAARELADGLRRESIDVWLDEQALVPGQDWRSQIAEALQRSGAMVVLLTPRSVESDWVRGDVEYALTSKRFEHRLIPVVIGDQTAPWLDKAPWVLKQLQPVVSTSPAKASRRVADLLRRAG